MPRAKSEPSSDLADPNSPAEVSGEPGGAAAPKKKKKKKKKVDKAELVREAMAALGPNARNQDIVAWVKDHRRVTVSPSHVSNIKSEMRKEEEEQEKGWGGVADGPAAEQAVGGFVLEGAEVRMLQRLIKRIGRNRAHEVIDLFFVG